MTKGSLSTPQRGPTSTGFWVCSDSSPELPVFSQSSILLMYTVFWRTFCHGFPTSATRSLGLWLCLSFLVSRVTPVSYFSFYTGLQEHFPELGCLRPNLHETETNTILISPFLNKAEMRLWRVLYKVFGLFFWDRVLYVTLTSLKLPRRAGWPQTHTHLALPPECIWHHVRQVLSFLSPRISFL